MISKMAERFRTKLGMCTRYDVPNHPPKFRSQVWIYWKSEYISYPIVNFHTKICTGKLWQITNLGFKFQPKALTTSQDITLLSLENTSPTKIQKWANVFAPNSVCALSMTFRTTPQNFARRCEPQGEIFISRTRVRIFTPKFVPVNFGILRTWNSNFSQKR